MGIDDHWGSSGYRALGALFAGRTGMVGMAQGRMILRMDREGGCRGHGRGHHSLRY